MNAASVAWLRDHFPSPEVFFWITDAGGPLGWWVVLQFVILLVGTQRGLRLAWLVCLAAWSNTVLKYLIVAPRPFWLDGGVEALRVTDGFGMPSGHAQGAAALLVGCALLLSDRRPVVVWSLALLAAGLIAVSRVYLGVHSVAQVLVGLALGIVLSLLLWRVLPRLEDRLLQCSLLTRLLSVAALCGAAAGGLWGAWRYAVSVALSPEWGANVAAAAARLGEPVEVFAPADSGVVVLVVLMLGYLLLALVATQQGHRRAHTASAAAGLVGAAVAINAILFALINALGSGQLPWMLFQPLLAIWLPLWWFGTATSKRSA